MSDPVSMQPSDWITLGLGAAAFLGTIWSNITAHKALRTTGRQRVAEFRKEWIESLRSDVGEFLTLIVKLGLLHDRSSKLTGMIKSKKNISATMVEFFDIETAKNGDLLRQTAIELTGRFNKLRLTLNQAEPLQAEILTALEESYSATIANETVVPITRIVHSTQRFLKTEWDEKVVRKLN